jgi:hypothetical protein
MDRIQSELLTASPHAMLDYREGSDAEPLRVRVRWVAVAAVAVAAAALIIHATDFIIYFTPDSFQGVGTMMQDRGRTNWANVTMTLLSASLSMTLLIAAVLYLRGRDTRRMLVLVAAVMIVSTIGMAGYEQYSSYRNSSTPDRIIHAVWGVGHLIENLLLPGLMIAFFHRGRSRQCE